MGTREARADQDLLIEKDDNGLKLRKEVDLTEEVLVLLMHEAREGQDLESEGILDGVLDYPALVESLQYGRRSARDLASRTKLTVRLSALQSKSEKNPWWRVEVPNRVHRFRSKDKSPPCSSKIPIKDF